MKPENYPWPASRIVHLLGGCRAINIDGPLVRIEPNTVQGKTVQFSTQGYSAIYSDLKSIGLDVVGVDFYSHISEVKGETPPNWRVYNRTNETSWASEETAQTWKGIAHSAFKKQNGHVWDLASRIGYQLRVCSWRIRQLSEAYHEQLLARLQRGEAGEGQHFEDGYTWLAYLAVQSALVDACILRDYLAEFAANFVIGKRYGIDTKNVSSVGGLIKKVLNKVSKKDPLVDQLKNATGNSGWLKILGEYRDLVVHSAPLAHAEERLFAVSKVIKIDPEGSIPIINIPLPENPGRISSNRASRSQFSDFKRQFDKFAGSAKGEAPSIDALTYMRHIHGMLSNLAKAIADESPIPYQDFVLRKDDILGPIRIINR